MNIGYIRVSTINQETATQEEILKKYNIDKYFIEKVSGKNTKDRKALNEMLDYCREGDTIYIRDFSRLARNTKDLLDIIEYLEKKKVNLISDKENLQTNTAAGKLMITMLSAIYQFEREIIVEKVKEGVALAKQENRYKGGQPKKIDEKLYTELVEQYNSRKINKKEFAEKLGVSRPTLDKIMKDREV